MQEEDHKLEASQGFIASSRPDWDTVSKKNFKNQKLVM